MARTRCRLPLVIEMDDPSKVESTAEKLKKDDDFQKIADDGDVNASVL